jgi:hypothetical protein
LFHWNDASKLAQCLGVFEQAFKWEVAVAVDVRFDKSFPLETYLLVEGVVVCAFDELEGDPRIVYHSLSTNS